MIIEYLTPTKSKSIWSICLPLPLRSFCAPFDQLKAHLTDFLRAYNFARRLKPSRDFRPTNTSVNSGRKHQTDLLSTNPSNAGTKHLVTRRVQKP